MLKRRIKRITIKNYRSITDLTVEMPDLMVLVGENGSGKSNFVDALRFLRDAMFGFNNFIIREGGINRLINRVRLNDDMSIEIVCEIDATEYIYGFTIEKQDGNEYRFKKEFLKRDNEMILHYEDNQWHITPDNIKLPHPTTVLTLPALQNYDEIAPVYDLFDSCTFLLTETSLGYGVEEFYKDFKFFPTHDDIQSRLYDIWQKFPQRREQLREYLKTLIPFIDSFSVIRDKHIVITEFTHTNGAIFNIPEESDGTLRILNILVTLYQLNTPSLLAIEEPELFIHPGALALLCEIIEEASLRQQIIITTHSPDLIAKFDVDAIRVVELTDDGTKIDVIADSQLEAINEKLFGTGDILRIDGRLKRKEHEA